MRDPLQPQKIPIQKVAQGLGQGVFCPRGLLLPKGFLQSVVDPLGPYKVAQHIEPPIVGGSLQSEGLGNLAVANGG